MSEYVKVVVDAMGGDNAPMEIIKGAVEAIKENAEVQVIFTGKQELIEAELKQYEYNKEQVEIVDAREVIEMAEPPVNAIRTKKDSSIVKGMGLVKEGQADAFVSCGSTGAVLVGGQVLVGRLPGVQRPPLAPLIPTAKGMALLIDCGANMDAKPAYLVQFAKMGTIYMKNIMGIENPKVGIVNVGAEEEKGNALVKETFPLLKACPDINFVGSVEARDIPNGDVDVIVCDAFVGNVILKLYEGVGMTLVKLIKDSMMSTTRGKVGGMLVKPGMKQVMKKFSTDAYGGAPLLGLKGLVVKSHGSSKAEEVKNSILQCVDFKKSDINRKISESLSKTGESAE